MLCRMESAFPSVAGSKESQLMISSAKTWVFADQATPSLWTGEKLSVAVTVPIATYRNRIRSAPEEVLGRPAGDAAFADYFVQASVGYRF